MAGMPDLAKADRIRRLLLRKDLRDASDKEISLKAECSRFLVRVVRTRMIVRGELKLPKNGNHFPPGSYDGHPVKIRGGYVLNPRTGRVELESEYNARKRKRK